MLELSARGVGGFGSGFGKDWNALSARSPSPTMPLAYEQLRISW